MSNYVIRALIGPLLCISMKLFLLNKKKKLLKQILNENKNSLGQLEWTKRANEKYWFYFFYGGILNLFLRSMSSTKNQFTFKTRAIVLLMYLSGKFTNTMGWYKGSKIIYNAQTRMPHFMNYDGLNWGFIHTEYTITIVLVMEL